MDSPNGHTSHEFSKYLILPGNQDNSQFPNSHSSHEWFCFRFACIFITSSETNFIAAALRTNKGTSHGDVSTKTPESGYTLCPVNYKIATTTQTPPPPLNTPGRASYSVLSYALPGPDFLESSPPCRPTRASKRSLRYWDRSAAMPRRSPLALPLDIVQTQICVWER